MGFIEEWNNLSITILDSLAKSIIAFAVATPFLYWIGKWNIYQPIKFGIMFMLFIIISTILSRIIKVNLGYIIKIKFDEWMEKIIGTKK